MWPFKKKGFDIKPGESKEISFDIPKNAKIAELTMNYDDKYGNKYETKVLVNFEEKKIMKQTYKTVKKIRDIPEKDMPKLVIQEKDLENLFK